jgi:hypothetical protein
VTTPVEQAQKIQRLARIAHWLRVAIHLVGSAALCAFGWGRGVDAIPTFLFLFAPLVITVGLVVRVGGEPRRYGQYLATDAASAAHHIAAVSRQRNRDPRGALRDALWWFSTYVENVTLGIAVALAIDAWGGPLAVGIAGTCAMLALTGVANALDLRMRLADATLTLMLTPHDAADAPERSAEGN